MEVGPNDATDITYSVEGTGDRKGAWTQIYSSATTSCEGDTDAPCQVTVSDTTALQDAPNKARFLGLKIARP